MNFLFVLVYVVVEEVFGYCGVFVVGGVLVCVVYLCVIGE